MKTLGVLLVGLLVIWGVSSPPNADASCEVQTVPRTYANGAFIGGDLCDASGNKKVTSGTSPAGTGSATAAAPTLTEASQGYFSWDLAGNLRITLGTCLSGESACIATSPTSYMMVAPAVPRATIAGTAITTDTTSATYTLPAGAKTPVAIIAAAGAQTQTYTIFGAADSTAANGKLLCTITLNGAVKDVDTCDSGAQITQDWPFYYHTSSSTTGGASGTLTFYNGLVGGGAGTPIRWSCNLNGVGTTLTECQAVPGAGLSLYITDIVTQSTTATAGQHTLRFGTGTNCGTGTGNLFFGLATVSLTTPGNASTPSFQRLTTPIKVTANNAVCVLGVVTNTTNIQINGFTAP